MFSQQEKQLKKRFLSELPRRTSDRIAIKTAIKEEGVSCGLAPALALYIKEEGVSGPVLWSSSSPSLEFIYCILIVTWCTGKTGSIGA